MTARATPPDIELLVLDADGVLTDGSIWIDDRGRETKRFHVRDGFAMRAWLKAGKELAVITGRGGLALRHRLEGLGVRHLISSSGPKRAALEEVWSRVGVDAAHTAVLGDDLPDLPMLRMAGFPMAVADAADEVKSAAVWHATRAGGHGAVREAVEFLLKACGRWDAVVGDDR
jgi:3-deoxy-D-manno-octulosonate 8-phosphate phosphatase (KDO 8-P phosphatase)